MEDFTLSKQELVKKYGTDEKKGLSSSKVEELAIKYGKNQLREKKKKTLLQKFIDQFKDVMIIILIIASIISFVVAIFEQDKGEIFEPILIAFVVIMNAILGVIQENRAEKSLEALKKLSTQNARVIRDGQEFVIDALNLVPGDIIKLEAGDFVPADARLIESSNLKCEESILTGESLPSEKDANEEITEDAQLGDRKNMIFSGCSVVLGTALAVVVKTGMDTQIGHIANLLDSEEEQKTPLQEKMTHLGKYLGIMAVIACAIIFIIGLLDGIKLKSIFMTSVALAVSAIPEGLPATITIILSIGVQRMVSKNAIIRKLTAVETLGSASIICSDKTGTLTKNRMTLVTAYTDELKKEEDISKNNSESVKELLKYATLCCDGTVTITENEEKHIGDPTETSIIKGAMINGMDKDELNKIHERVASIPFDSNRKLMTSVNKVDNKYIVIVKGAFESLMDKCIKGDLELAKKYTETMSSKALRVISVAYKYIDKLGDITEENLENNLIFLGLVGMIDPEREEVKDAVNICKNAGIRPIMITGDHITTAKAIAQKIGIFKDGDLAITGRELDNLEEKDFMDKIRKISVYARVSPQNKIRIVKAWQNLNEVVAMTGDGVNDAPALKAADIGCAMGITGTDVAKNASDMILTDDNFATIVHAVREGRGIYDNIRKVIEYLIGSNIGEVLVVFVSMLIWRVTPLESMQLLWINLVTDGLPGIALGMTKVDKDVMNNKPKKKNAGVFANKLGLRVFLEGVIFACATLLGFCIGKEKGGFLVGKTVAFTTLSLSQVLFTYVVKSKKSIFNKELFDNKYLNLASLSSIILIALVLFTPLVNLFGLCKLEMSLYGVAALCASIPLVIISLLKQKVF